MNENTIRALIDAGAVKQVHLIADGTVIHVNLTTQTGTITATTNKGVIKTWGSLDSAAKWIRKLGIGEARLEISKWLPKQRGLSFNG